MFTGDRLVDVADLEKMGQEITEEESKKIPYWGSGNISVDEAGVWKWEATNHDSSD